MPIADHIQKKKPMMDGILFQNCKIITISCVKKVTKVFNR